MAVRTTFTVRTRGGESDQSKNPQATSSKSARIIVDRVIWLYKERETLPNLALLPRIIPSLRSDNVPPVSTFIITRNENSQNQHCERDPRSCFLRRFFTRKAPPSKIQTNESTRTSYHSLAKFATTTSPRTSYIIIIDIGIHTSHLYLYLS